jgi:hypothetical protein
MRKILNFNLGSEAAILIFLYFLIGGVYPEAIPVFPHRRRLSWMLFLYFLIGGGYNECYSCISSSEADILNAIPAFPHRRRLSCMLFLYFLIGGGYPEAIPVFSHRRRLSWGYSCIFS